MNSLCVDIGSMRLEQWSPSRDQLAGLSRAAVLCAERLQTIRKWEVPYTAKFSRPKKFTNCIYKIRNRNFRTLLHSRNSRKLLVVNILRYTVRYSLQLLVIGTESLNGRRSVWAYG